jgi:hypothetical protein
MPVILSTWEAKIGKEHGSRPAKENNL